VETCSRYYLGLFEQFELEHAIPAVQAVQDAREKGADLRGSVRHTFPNNPTLT
jgi:hypothetical protein